MQMSNILSYDEYARIETERFQRPYIVEVDNDNHEVLFLWLRPYKRS